MLRLPSSMPSLRWYKGLRLRGIDEQSLKLPKDITTPFTHTCFDCLLRCLRQGGTRGLTAGYKGWHFPKWVINYYGGTKGLTTGYKGQGGPKLKNGLKLKNGQLTLVGPLFGGVLFCAPHSFFGPGGIAHGRSQVHVKVPKTGQDMEWQIKSSGLAITLTGTLRCTSIKCLNIWNIIISSYTSIPKFSNF